MLTEEGNEQPKDEIFVQETKNSKSVIICYNTSEEREEKFDNYVRQQDSIKSEIIKQINYNNSKASEEVYLKEEIENQTVVKEEMLSSVENIIQPIDYFFIPKIENGDSIIINSNIDGELKEKLDKYDNNLEQQESIQIEIIKQINNNHETSDETNLQEEMEKQIVVKEDISSEEYNIQPIDYFFISKTECRESINSMMKEQLEEKSDKHDSNLEQQDIIKAKIIKQINDSDEIFDELHLEDVETKKTRVMEENTYKKLKRRSTRNIKGKFISINEKYSLKADTDNVTSTTNENLKREFLCKTSKLRRFNSRYCFDRCDKSNLIYNVQAHTKEKPCICNICDKKFSSPKHVRKHLRNHSDERKYACDQCSKRFIREKDLVKHIRTHTGEKPYTCDQCNKKFNQDCSLARHIRTHTGEKPYVCDHCSKSFTRQYDLAVHNRIHTGEKPYVCDHCSMRFNRRNNLMTHIRTHTGEKRYVCDQCSKKFNCQSDLVRHIRTHTGERPYVCDQCGKRFNRRYDLVAHIRTHTEEKPYVCDQCNARFNQQNDLVRHIRIHKSGKPYACN